MTSRRQQQVFILVGLVALAFNLRPAASSVGPVLSELQDALGMSPTTAGLLTTLPVLCFAAFGALAPWCAAKLGAHRVILLALVLAAAGLLARAAAPNKLAFIALSVPALAGMATANVLLPSLIKLHFPTRIGLLTAIYTTTLAIGMTLSIALTVPISDGFGSWRGGLAVWGATAAIAALPWLGLMRHDVHPDNRVRRSLGFTQVARTRLGWLMAVYFGIQSLEAYATFGWMPEIFRDADFSAQTAGLLLAVTTSVSIPVSFVLPGLAVRAGSQGPIVVGLGVCYLAGFAGLIGWPHGGAVAWALLIGLGTGAFPLALTFIGLRSETPDGTAALSGFTQSVGYLIAGVGPFMVGAAYDVTGSWNVPIAMLMALVVPQVLIGLLIVRSTTLEAELADQPSAVRTTP